MAKQSSFLNLKRNQLHGELPDNMNQSCSFWSLDFSDNQFEGKLPRSLVGCKYLEVFDIGNNHISDTFPCWMSMLPELQVLVLKSNMFVGEVGPSVAWEKNNCEFIKLRILDLASNKLSGTLQDEWFVTMKSMVRKSANDMMYNQVRQLGQTYHLTDAITYKGNEQVQLSTILSALVHIDVSDNAFHGAIPKSIGHLVLLNGVNMSHNALTGPIPPQFGALKQLESLDLSSNDLSGEIPQELGSLNFLSTLNLSYNELVGRIPDSTHFSTFSNLSFMGNIGLCGLQVSKVRNSTTPYVELQHSEKKDLMLFLVTGLGFGVGFAIAIIWTGESVLGEDLETTLSCAGRKFSSSCRWLGRKCLYISEYRYVCIINNAVLNINWTL
ncbi:LOW QUALITY PROTEIN: receptor-like protein 33 [Setaria viridis]|uniref:LOW QUALITY PROTEIN: receptor-like protein 33 n=1 Tax=Setaria viridis TaxID=4556 RepID=UPI003B3B3D3A